MTQSPFIVSSEHHVAHLRLDRPQASNAMNLAFWREFPEAVRRMDRSGTVRALVISGAGKNFCTGMDVSVFTGGQTTSTETPSGREAFVRFAREVQDVISILEIVRFPVIAAIQGACVGGGLELAAACDLRFAAENAYFRIEEINIGMMADIGSLQRLPRMMPDAVVKEMAFMGSTLSAARALAVGFVNDVKATAEDALAAAMAAAQVIASKAPLAIAGSKESIRYARDNSVAAGLDRAALLQAAIWNMNDIGGAIRARQTKTAMEFAPLLPLKKFGE